MNLLQSSIVCVWSEVVNLHVIKKVKKLTEKILWIFLSFDSRTSPIGRERRRRKQISTQREALNPSKILFRGRSFVLWGEEKIHKKSYPHSCMLFTYKTSRDIHVTTHKKNEGIEKHTRRTCRKHKERTNDDDMCGAWNIGFFHFFFLHFFSLRALDGVRQHIHERGRERRRKISHRTSKSSISFEQSPFLFSFLLLDSLLGCWWCKREKKNNMRRGDQR